jgi:hypothetical protein
VAASMIRSIRLEEAASIALGEKRGEEEEG